MPVAGVAAAGHLLPCTLGYMRPFPGGGGGPTLPVLTGLQAWYDASDAASFTFASGNIVSQWNDKSGNNFHLTQSTAALRPTRAVGVVNGLAAVQFNMAGAANGQGMVSNCPADNQPFSMYVALTHHAVTDVGMITGNNNSGGPYSPNWRMRTDRKHEVLLPAVGNMAGPSTAAVTVDTPSTVGIEYAANGAWTCYVNGAASGTGTNPVTITAGVKLVIGAYEAAAGTSGSYPYSGQICEFARYSRILSGAERQQVQDYLKTKWATA